MTDRVAVTAVLDETNTVRHAVLPDLSLLAMGSAFAVLATVAFRFGLVDSLFTNGL